mgnify:CR=1 FL=1
MYSVVFSEYLTSHHCRLLFSSALGQGSSKQPNYHCCCLLTAGTSRNSLTISDQFDLHAVFWVLFEHKTAGNREPIDETDDFHLDGKNTRVVVALLCTAKKQGHASLVNLSPPSLGVFSAVLPNSAAKEVGMMRK